MRPNIPQFKAGDTVRVHFQVIEGQRRRTQVFEGIVIKRQGSGVHETFTVRKQSFGVGVERTFPLHSPKIERIEVAAIGVVRRAKLYYLRDKVGKRARVRTKAGAIFRRRRRRACRAPARAGRGRHRVRTSSRPRTTRLRMRRPRRRLPPATSPFPRPSPIARTIPGRLAGTGTSLLGVESAAVDLSASRGRTAFRSPPHPHPGWGERPPAARGERIGRTRTRLSRDGTDSRTVQRVHEAVTEVVTARRGYPRRVPVRTGQKLLRFDRKLGARYVAGADEAGRGSLAGPLVVAGVLLDYGCLRNHRVRPLGLLNDSKQVDAGRAGGALSCRRRLRRADRGSRHLFGRDRSSTACTG